MPGTTTGVITDIDGNFDKAKHYLRPIPLEHLERITQDGHALTKEQINAIQNPGY